MTTSLDRLPFDLIFCITLDLELEDIVHLGQTCRHLRAVLDERTVVRRTVEVRWRQTVNVLTPKLTLLIDQLSVYRRSKLSPKRGDYLQAGFSGYL